MMRRWLALVAFGACGLASACALITGVGDLNQCADASCSVPGIDAYPAPDAAGDAPLAGDVTSDGTRDVHSDVAADSVQDRGDGPSDARAEQPSLTCEGGLSACGAACVDVTTDGANCGACGHSCLGGACQSSACQPVTLAAGLNAPAPIALSSSEIFVGGYLSAPSGYVAGIPLAGGALMLLVTGQYDVRHLTVDAQHIYWVNRFTSGSVEMANLDGSSPTVLAAAQDEPWDVVVDATTVYWTNASVIAGGGAVNACAIAGCGGVPTPVAAGRPRPMGLRLSGGRLFWVEANAGTLVTCPTAGCGALGPTILASGQSDPQSLTIDAANAYWISDVDGSVLTCPLTGGVPTMLGTSVRTPVLTNAIAVDATSVYWTSLGDGVIRSCAIGGCGGVPKVIATGYPGAAGIAVDGVAVYWTDFMAGTVTRLAK
jgi:hypothetical protein